MTVPASSVFLIGPMGAGKTTLGKRLARRLARRFIDADHELEFRTGVDIPYIFEREGEAGFREREAQLIEELTREPNIVLATGGGVVLSEDNRRHLAERGVVLYLYATVDQQLRRTAHSTHRPLLQTGESRRDILERLFRQRDPLYRSIADQVIDTNGESTGRLLERLTPQLPSWIAA